MQVNGTTEYLNFCECVDTCKILETDRARPATIISDENVAKTCSGHVNITSCLYGSAVGEYSVIADQIGLKLVGPVDPRIIAIANNTAITPATAWHTGDGDPNDVYSTLAGPVFAGSYNFLWNEKLIVMPGFANTAPGLVPNVPPGAVPFFENFSTWGKQRGISDCAPLWRDPREDVMSKLNELSKYVGTKVLFYRSSR